jgi:hypothetical protein
LGRFRKPSAVSMRFVTLNPPLKAPGAWPRSVNASAGQSAPPRPRLDGCEFAGDPRHRFPGRHQVRRRLEHFGHEPVAPVALALEIRSVTGRSGFKPGEFGFQRLDAGLKRGGDRTVIVR